jgi:ComF family protein
VLYPPSCASCGREGVRFCEDCLSKIPIIDQNICEICGEPQISHHLCDKCQTNLPPFTALRSYFEYSGPIRKAHVNLKYKNDLGLADTFSTFLISMIQNLGWEFDYVIPVPISKQHRIERGYNQAALIAYPIALAFNAHFSDRLIRRVKETKSQVDLSASERFKNLHNAFQGNSATLNHKKVLLVDDVTTTGATIISCSKALQESGCERIYCITIAKTPKLHQ